MLSNVKKLKSIGGAIAGGLTAVVFWNYLTPDMASAMGNIMTENILFKFLVATLLASTGVGSVAGYFGGKKLDESMSQPSY